MKNKRFILYSGLLIGTGLANMYGMHKLVQKKIDKEVIVTNYERGRMKNKRFILYSGLLIGTGLANMHAMHELVQKKIDKVNEEFDKQTVNISYDACFILGFFDWKREEFAKIVLTSGELMTDTQKLNYLMGDDYYLERKKIIKHMIDNKKVTPNEIVYQGKNPLKEAALFKDNSFKAYLLEKGAKFDEEIKK